MANKKAVTQEPPTPSVAWSNFEDGYVEVTVPKTKGPWVVVLLSPDQARQLAADLLAVVDRP